MRGHLLRPPPNAWECPNCDRTLLTRPAETRIPLHPCRGLAGLTAPFVRAGTRADVRPVERGDWVGREQVQTNADGRPFMAVTTERDDGIDCHVLAPAATASKE